MESKPTKRWSAVRPGDGWSSCPETKGRFADIKRYILKERRKVAEAIGVAALIVLISPAIVMPQTPQPMPPGQLTNPERPLLAPVDQADENFSFLRDPSKRTDFWDPLKYIPLSQSGDSYLTFWFENRSEYEWFQNQMWGQGPQTISGYWLQRVIPAVGLSLGPHVRLYSSFQYDKEMGNNAGPRLGIDEDQGDFHEAFIDISSGLDDQRSVTARLGQQELVYGTGRLVDNDEGVNVKSSFYGARLIARTKTLRLEIFGVKPTEQNTGTFDDRPTSQQTFWGAYGTVPLRLVDQFGWADLYYLGIDTTRATYEQGTGREICHSIGTRLFNHQPGAPFQPGLDYNWEFVYQLGTFGRNYINAWTVATETGFTFPVRFLPRIAFRADIASGGQHPNGGTLNTFNPLFPRGAYFGPKLTMFGPYNMFDVHPVLMLSLFPNVTCDFDWVWFWRQSFDDGIYAIGGALLRPSSNSKARYIGSQANFELRWALDLQTTIAINLAGFITGGFLKDTGPAGNVAYSNVGITYKF
jgi:Alginate export